MTDRKTTGIKGEEMSVLFLRKLGYEIIILNWRHKKLEVDIIAKDGETLVFVEVKVRRSSAFAEISDLINTKKQENMFEAAEAYLELYPGYEQIRFDVIVYINNKLTYIKDAFWNY